jgi:hypothetical protein
MSEAQAQRQFGKLAEAAGRRLELRVCISAAGFYLGTYDEKGLPFSRESVESWGKRERAEYALAAERWTQRRDP